MSVFLFILGMAVFVPIAKAIADRISSAAPDAALAHQSPGQKP